LPLRYRTISEISPQLNCVRVLSEVRIDGKTVNPNGPSDMGRKMMAEVPANFIRDTSHGQKGIAENQVPGL
jgi:hypothetical protein